MTQRLVIGVGSPIRGDDAIGLVVGEALARTLGDGCAYEPFAGAALDLAQMLATADRVVIVDALEHGDGPPGECVEVALPPDLPLTVDPASHPAGVLDALAVGRWLGVRRPTELRLFGIRVAKGETEVFREGLSAALAGQVPRIVAELRAALVARGVA